MPYHKDKRAGRRSGRGRRAVGWLAALTAGAGLLAGCGHAPSAAARPLAVVNGRPVTAADWHTFLAATEVLQGTPIQVTAQVQQAGVQDLVQDDLVTQWALAHHWTTEAAASRQAEQVLNQDIAPGLGGAKALKASLARFHLSPAAFRQYVTQQIIVQEVYNRVTAPVPAATAAQAAAYYHQHPGQFIQPPEIEVRHILVKTKAEAEKLLNQIRHGASFSALARRYSLDKASAVHGGELGWVLRGPQSGLVPHFYEVMDQLQPGQYGIAHTRYGYHIIEVQAVRAGQVMPLNAVEAQVEQQLTQTARDNAYNAFVARIRQQSHVTITGSSTASRSKG
ncbi:Peptidylprolyl isomerase [Candidatus Hydrogenisulfobacillus filiaventi]|uniref:Peptidylprolyl isomerase n=1 Tax=Candidatus Hydrogenisulfobacillus filiaventi TaxID=2707344 RepID=A0A6F8ZJJ2_9FIRM|nr:peptidylprolyl isomerase [Bacillota bacterium]CAB1130114.1 Peptidylprolyl isomerase [Candidatus Hydrogenisulfobacillus filiaventi]